MRRLRNMFQTKEQHITSEKELNKVEESNPANREFKIKIITMLTKLRRQMNRYSGNFKKEL